MKNNIKYLFLFIGLIMVIIGLLLFNLYEEYRGEKKEIEYIFPEFTYDYVLNTSKELFLKGINLVNINKYDYEKDALGNIKFYSINDVTDYKKIKNFNVQTILSKENIPLFLNDYKIIFEDNIYYIENYEKEYNTSYIGSRVSIDSYNDKEVNLKITSYYGNGEYKGIIKEEPQNYTAKKTTYLKIVYESKSLKIKDYQELLKIIA